MESKTSTVGAPKPGIGRRGWLLLVACVALGMLLRGIEAHGKSLWLDELHTLDVASRATYTELNDFLKKDVHTPLFYLAVQALHGEVEVHALRWLAIVGSLLCVLPLIGLARATGMSATSTVAVCGVYCALPYQIQWGAELRPYAWLELAALTLAWAAFTPCPTRASRAVHAGAFAAAVAFGSYTHLFTAIALLGVGAGRLVFRLRDTLGLPALLASGALGMGIFAPWLVTSHPWLFREPQVLVRDEAGVRTADHRGASEPEIAPATAPALGEPESSFLSSLPEWVRKKVSLRTLTKQLLQVPLNTLVPRIGSLHGFSAVLAHYGLLGLLALVIAVTLYAASNWRDRARDGYRPSFFTNRFAAVIFSTLVASVILAIVCVKLVNRMPLQYFALSAWSWPLVVGALVDAATPRGRALVAGLFVAAAATAGFGQATGAPRENLRDGVALAVREARERGAWLTAILWQPNYYAHTTAFQAYAPNAAFVEPEDVPPPPAPGGEREIVVLTRSAPDESPTNWEKWGPIVADSDRQTWRHRISVQHVDDSISVYVYGLP